MCRQLGTAGALILAGMLNALAASAADDDRKQQQQRQQQQQQQHRGSPPPAPAASPPPARFEAPRSAMPRHEPRSEPRTSPPAQRAEPPRSPTPAPAVVAPERRTLPPSSPERRERHYAPPPAVQPAVRSLPPTITPMPASPEEFRTRMPRRGGDRARSDDGWRYGGGYRSRDDGGQIRHHHHHRPPAPWLVRSVPPRSILVVPRPIIVEVPGPVVILPPYVPVPEPTVPVPWVTAPPPPVRVTLYVRALDDGPLQLDLQAAADVPAAEVVTYLRQVAAAPELPPDRACRFAEDGVASMTDAAPLPYARWSATPVFATLPEASDPTYWIVLTDDRESQSCLAYRRTARGDTERAEAREDLRNAMTALLRMGAKPDLADAPQIVTVDFAPGAPLDPTRVR